MTHESSTLLQRATDLSWRLAAASALAMLAAGAPNSWAQTWAPNETQASPQTDLIDYEFSLSRGMLAWNDCCGNLWLATVDKATGLFVPADGKGMLLDPDSMTFQDAQKTKNGPEWVSMAGGDTIVSTKFNGKHTQGNARIGYTAPLTSSSVCSYISADGYWCTNYLGPDVTRMAPYGSKLDNDPAPRISYVDNKGNHFWREVLNPATERPITGFPPSNYPVRHVICSDPSIAGTRAAVYPLTDNSGIDQVVYNNYDGNTATQLTFDATTKYEVWMWCAPEYNNELVFFTLVNEVELRVYRYQPTGSGDTQPWKSVLSYSAPNGNKIYSPEPFVYNGHSYIFMSQALRGSNIRTQAWIASADVAHQLFRLITPETPFVSRTDPEVFITDNGPMIYYNSFTPDVTSTGRPKSCRDPSCSRGVWFADPGLKAWSAQLSATTAAQSK